LTEANIHIANLLLTRISEGDKVAFHVLFNQYRNKIYAILYTILNEQEKAERLLLLIFYDIWACRETLPEAYSLNEYVEVLLCRYLNAGCEEGTEALWLEKQIWIKTNGDLAMMQAVTLQKERAEELYQVLQQKQASEVAWTRGRLWLMAALITGVIAIGILWFNNYYRAFHTYITQKGERKTFILPDGTKVKLNGGSTLRLAGGYGSRLREVELKGEGYFEVKKDSTHKFVLHTSSMNIQDPGAAFSVRSYPHEKADIAAAINGKVNITLKDKRNVTMYRVASMQKLTVSKPVYVEGEDEIGKPRIELLDTNHNTSPPREISWIMTE